MFKSKKKKEEEEQEAAAEKAGLSPGQMESETEKIINSVVPEDQGIVKKILAGMTNEFMAMAQENRILRKEVKSAVKRKNKGRHKDPLLPKLAIAIFTQPKVENTKARVHFADNAKGEDVINTLRRVLKDPDNAFLGFYVMQEMAGKPNGYLRMQANTECAWKLFQELDKSCDENDPALNPTAKEGSGKFDPSLGQEI